VAKGLMKIAIISDIHSNANALNAVLADMTNVDTIFCAGDIVGYYADPNEVCELLRQAGNVTIRGNHDAYVMGELAPREGPRAAYRTDWTREVLTKDNHAWLATLSVEVSLELDGKQIKFRHASPWDEETYLYPDSKRLQDIHLEVREILILGHTHWPMAVHCGEGILINPGSVGQPRDWSPMASYVILDTRTLKFEFRRVSYDVEKLQERLARQGWDHYAISVLNKSKNNQNINF
jgi:putative phosphoesterase